MKPGNIFPIPSSLTSLAEESNGTVLWLRVCVWTSEMTKSPHNRYHIKNRSHKNRHTNYLKKEH